MLLQPYQPQWTQDFLKIEQILAEALPNRYVQIVHIGSTAVPDLAAKPILDIDIVLVEGVDFELIKANLASIGYQYAGNQGIADREVFKRKNTTEKHPVLDNIAHHLYACPTESEELKRHILFRDYLKNNPKARQAYQKLKYEIAEEAQQDRKKYAEIKETKARKFILDIIQAHGLKYQKNDS